MDGLMWCGVVDGVLDGRDGGMDRMLVMLDG